MKKIALTLLISVFVKTDLLLFKLNTKAMAVYVKKKKE